MSDGMYKVFYDGSCPLCRRTKKEIEKFDRNRWITWISIDRPSLLESYPCLEREKVQREMHLLENNTYLYTGFAAVRKIIQLFPGGKLISFLFMLPGGERVGNYFYRVVAKNRYKFFRNECSGESCSLNH